MRVTLASLLAEAMQDVSQFQSVNIDSQKYLEWVDKYQVSDLYFLSSPPALALFLFNGYKMIYFEALNRKC